MSEFVQLESLNRPAGGSWQVHFGSARVVFGAGVIDQIGTITRELRGSRALLVTDPGVREVGHVERAERALHDASVRVDVFDAVHENPTEHDVEAGLAAALDFGTDFLIGLGGGSVMDCAKGINFLLTNGGRMEDYWGTNLATKPMLPSIGIPTTSGTGSESQSYALIERERDRRKMACGDDKARFRAVLLDPALTATMPREVAASCGMDAVSHATESYVTTRRNPVSQMFAREAWRLLDGNLATTLDRPDDVNAQGRMLLGAFLSGAAIEASMLGAAHACANPLTSRFEVSHGAAVLLLLPHVVRFNAADAEVGDLYRELHPRGGGGDAPPLADRLEELRATAKLPSKLSEFPIPMEILPMLAREAAEQWTARYNPRPVSEADFLRLYEAAY